MKTLIKLLLVLAFFVYIGYGIGCTIQHNRKLESISPYCASCWALTDLFKGEE